MPLIKISTSNIDTPIEIANVLIQLFNANTVQQTIALNILHFLGVNKYLIMIVIAGL